MDEDEGKINREQRDCNISLSKRSYIAICGSAEINIQVRLGGRKGWEFLVGRITTDMDTLIQLITNL